MILSNLRIQILFEAATNKILWPIEDVSFIQIATTMEKLWMKKHMAKEPFILDKMMPIKLQGYGHMVPSKEE